MDLSEFGGGEDLGGVRGRELKSKYIVRKKSIFIKRKLKKQIQLS